MYDDFHFRESQGKFFLERRDGSTPKILRAGFSKNDKATSVERVVLTIFGVLFFIFATYYLEMPSPPEHLSAFHWIWH